MAPATLLLLLCKALPPFGKAAVYSGAVRTPTGDAGVTYLHNPDATLSALNKPGLQPGLKDQKSATFQ